MKIKKLWQKFRLRFRRCPEKKRQRQLLNLWRSQRDIRLPWFTIPHPKNLPLWLLRRANRCRSLAVTEAAERNARMASWLARQRPLRRIKRKTRSGCVSLALQKQRRLCLRSCRLFRRRQLIRAARWLLVHLICLILWAVLLSLPLWLPRLSSWLGQKKFLPVQSGS